MKGIIFNTQDDFDVLELALRNYVDINTTGSKFTKWCSATEGDDGTFLMNGVDDSRLEGFDFTGYTIEDINTNDTKYFPTDAN